MSDSCSRRITDDPQAVKRKQADPNSHTGDVSVCRTLWKRPPGVIEVKSVCARDGMFIFECLLQKETSGLGEKLLSLFILVMALQLFTFLKSHKTPPQKDELNYK